ncbi:glycerophosphodiester phosphodiesterase GDPDL3-like [Punica granatum]|uniref:glycerophosphodiester phosphodiesterase n=1 Tax=Punica granatum TaxID=22663 RepID=A0A6P8BZ30_PUNGR|nr:glycerophosphodiester phosphodiesterase GDPDL3-like [Punica granatum]
MCNSRAAAFLEVLLVSSLIALASAQGSTKWLTLSGNPPLVIARGGFSGIFPDSSLFAYNLAMITSVPDVVMWCDVQLTKDEAGICASDLRLDNSTSIASAFRDKEKTYDVNGVSMKGWFSIDFTLKDLATVYLTQGIGSRSPRFDGNFLPILTAQEVIQQLKPPGLWLNIQHDQFFSQHNLSMRNYVLSTSRSVPVSYISSPEVNFLRSIVTRFNRTRTKLVFRFLARNIVEPSRSQTYDSLSKNLAFIKTFASGILVPKAYIYPVTPENYVQPYSSIVSDAHKIGLEVYASDFVNDQPLSYNYSYDPIEETLHYIDNGVFSVDGLLTDFPITQSEAIDCFAHVGKNNSRQVKFLVISYNGASGDYPSCTDKAYTKAIQDGADVIDCPVQMSKDGVPFCFQSINLMEASNIAQSEFRNRTTTILELRPGPAIFSFSLTWSEVQSLTPQISNPYQAFSLYRNPANRMEGKFVSLSDFLALARNTSLSGVLLRIENATYLAENQGLSVTDAVLDVLSKAGYNNLTTMKVMIQSTNSSVLTKIKGHGNYELVYEVDENIRDAANSTVEDIKSFANSVAVTKMSVLPTNSLYLTMRTNTVAKLQAYKLPVYVQLFSNEFVSQAWDFFSDATVEINSFVTGAGVDGVITDFPRTAATYKRNKCLGLGAKTPAYMTPVGPGSLVELIPPSDLPPAQPPSPVLTDSDVNEPPLPAVVAKAPSPTPGANIPTAPTPRGNGQPKLSAPIFLSVLPVLVASLFLAL